MDSARHVIRYRFTRLMRVHNVFVYVASIMHQFLFAGEGAIHYHVEAIKVRRCRLTR